MNNSLRHNRVNLVFANSRIIDSHFVSRRTVELLDEVGDRSGGESGGGAGADEATGGSCAIPSDWRINSVAVACRWSNSRTLASSCAVERSTRSSRASKLWIAVAKSAAMWSASCCAFSRSSSSRRCVSRSESKFERSLHTNEQVSVWVCEQNERRAQSWN